jgi:hypothetical protein
MPQDRRPTQADTTPDHAKIAGEIFSILGKKDG